jgi:predicted XRE-type DNA-binding protein
MPAKKSSGNLLIDLGLAKEEPQHVRIRYTLMDELRRLIEERGMSTDEASSLLGVTPARIGSLLHGRVELFSIDTLVEMMARAGIQVDVVFSTLQPGSA